MPKTSDKSDPVAEIRMGLRALCGVAIRVQRTRAKPLAGYVEITGFTKNGGYFTFPEKRELEAVGLSHSESLAVIPPERIEEVRNAVAARVAEQGGAVKPAPKRGRPR
jgi:hypothetical protein